MGPLELGLVALVVVVGVVVVWRARGQGIDDGGEARSPGPGALRPPKVARPAAPPSEQLLAEVVSFLKDGNRIGAVKRYREATGVELKEALEAVTAIGEGKAAAVVSSAVPGRPLDDAQDEALRQLLRAGQKIQAIKLYREQTGVGLKEAKEAIEDLEGTLEE